MTNFQQDNSVGQSNLESISQAEQLKFKPSEPIPSYKPSESPSVTGANKGVKAPKPPKVKVNHGKLKRGGRTGTTPAQRSASRHNIQSALLAKKSRRLR